MTHEAIPETPSPSPSDEPGAIDKVVGKTPWWTMSLALHTVAVLCLAYFIVLGRPAEADEATIVSPPRRPPVVPDMTRIDSSLPSTPIKTDRPATDPEVTKEPDVKSEDDTDPLHDGRRGENTEFLTKQPFNSRSVNATIGVGADAAGRKGGPFGGRKIRDGGLSGPGPTKPSEDAVLAALRWLARHQQAEGAWRVQGYVQRCRGDACKNNATAHEDFDTGVTGLALLAFLGAGYTHLSKDSHDGICFGDVVRNAVKWLQAHQDPEGCVGPRTAHKYMYNHAISTLALTEAYGMTGSNLMKENAQRAIDFLVSSQNPGKGWRYTAGCGDNDSSVTGWAIMALKSAELSDLRFPRTAYEGCRAWLDEATEENYYRTGYTHRGTGKVSCAHNQQFDHHEALSAIGMMARIFIERDRADARIRGAASLIASDLPVWKDNAIDFYTWYYASLALFQFDGDRKGALWTRYEERMKDVLVRNQNTESTGCRVGSWEPVDRWSCEGGRVYATAINALTLEVYYRYASVFTGSRK